MKSQKHHRSVAFGGVFSAYATAFKWINPFGLIQLWNEKYWRCIVQ
jgi:hypothetical protein